MFLTAQTYKPNVGRGTQRYVSNVRFVRQDTNHKRNVGRGTQRYVSNVGDRLSGMRTKLRRYTGTMCIPLFSFVSFVPFVVDRTNVVDPNGVRLHGADGTQRYIR